MEISIRIEMEPEEAHRLWSKLQKLMGRNKTAGNSGGRFLTEEEVEALNAVCRLLRRLW